MCWQELARAGEINFLSRRRERMNKEELEFNKLDLVEQVGSGIGRIREEMKKAGLKEPKFQFGKFLAVTLFRPTLEELGKLAGETPQKTPQKPTELEQKILDIIRKKPTITREEIAKELNVSQDTIKEYLEKLKSKRLLMRVGGRKQGYWEILK